MPGKILASLVSIAVFVYFTLTAAFFFVHSGIASRADNLCYGTVELASTSGCLSTYDYDYLQENLDKLSTGGENDRYFIRVKLEKQIEPGLYDTYFEDTKTIADDKAVGKQSDIIDRPLDVGDRISIFVEDRSLTVFGRLVNVAFLGYAPDEVKDIKVKSMRTAIITNRKSNAVKGYDVIAVIKTTTYGAPPAITKIIVVTKTNAPDGRSYTDNSYNISDPSNNDYIFPAGEFLRDDDVIGNERVIKYVQQ